MTHIYWTSQKMVKESWDSVREMTIGRCWIKSKILPVGMEAEISSVFGHMKNMGGKDSIPKLLEKFKKFSIYVTNDDKMCDLVERDLSEAKTSRWIPEEEDAFIQKRMVEDSYENWLSTLGDPNPND